MGERLMELLDKAGNRIEQMMIAHRVGDENTFSRAHKEAGDAVFEAQRLLETQAAGEKS